LYEAAARRFEALFDGAPVACLTFDRNGTVFEWNRAATELWEKKPHHALQQPIDRVLGFTQSTEALWNAVDRVFDGESVSGLEWQAKFEESRRKWVVANLFPIRSAEGLITGGILAAVDITARKELQDLVEAQLFKLNQNQIELEYQRDKLAAANAKLEGLAHVDGLTGLKNHRSFQEFFESQFQITRRNGGQLSVLLLDVDHFKQVNDRHGHQAGDDVLRQIGAVMLEVARRADYVARYGGEEFVVVLADTGRTGSLKAANRLRRAIASLEFPFGSVTASFGCATLNPEDANREELLARADAALYYSKSHGRNMVRHCDELPQAA
jgi:diguanylate cyclase (GGDEF)-like protein/PAS domain S-box-containing protein